MNIQLKALLLLVSFTFVSLLGRSQKDQSAQKLNTFYKYLELAYVDEIDGNRLVEDAIKAMLKDLDPHSTYFSAKDLQRANEPLQGNFEGVGIQFNILNDTITVVSPISGGPSEKLGIRSGDKIVKINEKTVAGVGFTNKDVADNLRGPKGSKVMVSIKRRNVHDLIDFEIIRDKIPIYSVDASYLVNNNIGYIKLNRFAATTMKEIDAAFDSLSDAGMESLILDLRGNSGGYLNIATDLSDMFLEKGKMIVYTQGRSYPKSETMSTRGGKFEKGKLVILIDEGSASASEIVSGAVQDWDRGIIIGRRSFGKGLVQKPFSLPDGSAVRLTVSRYYTPSGRSIQRPYENGDEEDYYNDLLQRYENGELISADSIHFPDSLKYNTLKNQRVVYGGGGIMPDIFIPLDTTQGSNYYSQLVRKRIFNDFTLEYLDTHRKELKEEYTSAQNFSERFVVTPTLLEAFFAFADQQKLERNQDDIATSKSLIEQSLKAMLARGIWSTAAYYMVTNQEDDAFNKAIEVIEDRTFKKMNIDYK